MSDQYWGIRPANKSAVQDLLKDKLKANQVTSNSGPASVSQYHIKFQSWDVEKRSKYAEKELKRVFPNHKITRKDGLVTIDFTGKDEAYESSFNDIRSPAKTTDPSHFNPKSASKMLRGI